MGGLSIPSLTTEVRGLCAAVTRLPSESDAKGCAVNCSVRREKDMEF